MENKKRKQVIKKIVEYKLPRKRPVDWSDKSKWPILSVHYF